MSVWRHALHAVAAPHSTTSPSVFKTSVFTYAQARFCAACFLAAANARHAAPASRRKSRIRLPRTRLYGSFRIAAASHRDRRQRKIGKISSVISGSEMNGRKWMVGGQRASGAGIESWRDNIEGNGIRHDFRHAIGCAALIAALQQRARARMARASAKSWRRYQHGQKISPSIIGGG